ncbi:MAG: hypothetical protein AAFN77_01030 [Planctomycetota bacterium]
MSRSTPSQFAMSLVTRMAGVTLAVAIVFVASGANTVFENRLPTPRQGDKQTAKQSNQSSKAKDDKDDQDEETKRELLPWEIFHPDFEDTDFDGTENRAWEYRPYKVAVWFCLDGSPLLEANYLAISAEVTQQSELMDPCGWDLTTGRAPAKFRSKFIRYLETPERCFGFDDTATIENFDKLMIVCLESKNSRIQSRVREFDVQTQQWGPINDRVFASASMVASGLAKSIAVSFMPLARIDRVTEVEYNDEKGTKRRRDEVVMQVRAVKSCLRTVLKEKALLETSDADTTQGDLPASAAPAEDGSDGDGQESDRDDDRFVWVAEKADTAPAFLSDSDRLLPIIRRTDRKGNLIKLEPIELTFLTIDSIEEAVVRSSIQSSARAPLSQRASKRAQKLALVIRPPANPTTLRLISRDGETLLEGFEIYSRKPGQLRDEASEFLGKTDWRGEIQVPPSEDGLRLIYVKRGNRPLKKIPIIPGLYSSVETTLPNDETRLYAEGVFKGLENEILGLVIQRKVAEAEVETALKKGIATKARAANEELRDLDTYSDLKIRVNTQAEDLKFQTTDTRERGYIQTQRQTLGAILEKQMQLSPEQELLEKVQDISAKSREEAKQKKSDSNSE